MRRRTSREPDATEALTLLGSAAATLATAESLTGGRLAAVVTAVPGASASYLGGFVTYATALKEALLGVPHELVERYGVVSAECAQAMATGCREATGATYALATTGVAGPDAQEGKPVGTVFVGVAGPEGVSALTIEMVGDRHQIQDRTCREALSALCRMLRAAKSGGEQPPLR
ncbi:MAG TPA: CinA family protein [Nocardioides sp.]|jgi:PncC family amidohydrolase|nr:CinA family protein [Nocardioides sp.]